MARMTDAVSSGSLLLATPSLIDPNFRRSAVLICEHGDQGTMGLIINRPLEASLSQLFSEIVNDGGELPDDIGSVFSGGPVETGRLMAIKNVRDGLTGDNDHPVLDGVVLVDDIRGAVEAIARREHRIEDYRFMLGYAGWGGGQLAGELSEESWFVRPATWELALGTRPEAIWPDALRELGGVHRLYAEMPIDPSMN